MLCDPPRCAAEETVSEVCLGLQVACHFEEITDEVTRFALTRHGLAPGS
jgi:hypothetical protein